MDVKKVIQWVWQWRRIVISYVILSQFSAYSVKASDIKTDYFLSKLMSKYGDSNEMPFDGFEHLLHHLGLGAGIVFDHDIGCHKDGDTFIAFHSNHNHSVLKSGGLTKNCSKRLSQRYDIHEHTSGHDHNHESQEHKNGHEHGSYEHKHCHDHGSYEQNTDRETQRSKHNHEHSDHSHTGHDHKHSHTHRRIPRNHTRSGQKHRGNDHKHDATTGSPKIKTDVQKHKTPESRRKSEAKYDRRSRYKYHLRTGSSKSKTNDNVGSTNHTEVSSTTSSIKPSAKPSVTKQDVAALDNTNDVTSGSTKGNTDIKEHPLSIEKRRVTLQEECMSPSELLGLVNMDVSTTITKEMFKELCPTLIYQIDTDACHQYHTKQHHHASDDYDHVHDHGHSHAQHEPTNATLGLNAVPAKVWGYSTIAVVIISLVGLLGVAVIPIMQRVFYHQLLQFLVALAVGALSGDALLHLLPHALSGDHHEETGSHAHGEEGHSHDNSSIFKCLCGLMGIYVFYLMERCLVILSAIRKKNKKTEKSKPSKGADIIVNTTDVDDEQMMQLNKPSSEYQNELLPETKHGHGHSHSMDGAPGSVAAVAWMIIMGDGIHNFCDGLAIGAAFVNSITAGFSTSIAVFCHELPHEIGDFAMLLTAGMTVKQAVFYNCVSSILCFIGMLVGVAIGNTAGASQWVFVVVAGMFLYIALVDMLPELTSRRVEKIKDALIELLLQLIGMLIGAGIMLVIALYEADLQMIFD